METASTSRRPATLPALAGVMAAPYPESFYNCMVDYNRIWTAPNAALINDSGTGRKYSSLDEIRQKFHWEHHGEVPPLANQTAAQAVAAMGGSVATCRVPWGKRRWASASHALAADAEFRWPAIVDCDFFPYLPQFFWHAADGHDDMSLFRNPSSCLNTDTAYCWQPCSAQGYGMGENVGCRWYCYAEAKYPADIAKLNVPMTGFNTLKSDDGTWTHCPKWSNGNHWLVMEGVTPQKMLPQGMGYWSPRLATAPRTGHHLAQDAGKEPVLQRQGLALRVAGFQQRNRPEPPAASSSAWTIKAKCTTLNSPRAAMAGREVQREDHRSQRRHTHVALLWAAAPARAR